MFNLSKSKLGLIAGVFSLFVIINANAAVNITDSSNSNAPGKNSLNEKVDPVSDISKLDNYIKLYNAQAGKTDQLVYSKPDNILKLGSEPASVYVTDINNDGVDEYVLVVPCGGSMCSGTVVNVANLKDGKLTFIYFDKLVNSNFHIGEMSNWYMRFADPFITHVDEKYYLNFIDDNDNSKVCSYFWKRNNMRLAKGDRKSCTHK